MSVQKKIPMRQCMGCREMKPKKELIRVVRSPEGSVSLDFKGKAPGRGAYLCPDLQCLKKARKSGSIGRVLEVEIPAEIYDEMETVMEKEAENG
ncbi:MAG: YlxR family protein [Oscillospiraceae bacterium]|nr:YlxR family protein [Oscillospiraceae bacterium]MBR6654802.1 YlxR family protein [Oscillospiraceae bacterium]